jgi:hypothetical protein
LYFSKCGNLIFVKKIVCACNYYLKHIQISSWDCNGIGFCEASTKQKEDDSDSDSDEIKQFAKITVIQSLIESLQSIGESPIKKKRLSEGKYPTRKMKRTEKAVET